jgi:hypothetical protein
VKSDVATVMGLTATVMGLTATVMGLTATVMGRTATVMALTHLTNSLRRSNLYDSVSHWSRNITQ